MIFFLIMDLENGMRFKNMYRMQKYKVVRFKSCSKDYDN